MKAMMTMTMLKSLGNRKSYVTGPHACLAARVPVFLSNFLTVDICIQKHSPGDQHKCEARRITREEAEESGKSYRESRGNR